MPKKLSLAQLAAKKYTLIPNLPAALVAAIGQPDDTFDALIHGESNNGKSSFIAAFVMALIKSLDCRAEYVAYEEAHGRTIQMTMIERYNMLEEIPGKLSIVDRYTYEELDKEIGKRKSAKIWVIDSLQASGITAKQYFALKEKYIGKRGKILIVISWSKGSNPMGSDADAINYYAALKLFVKKLVMFPKGRYGGGQPYVIHRETAIRRWGSEKALMKAIGETATRKAKPKTETT